MAKQMAQQFIVDIFSLNTMLHLRIFVGWATRRAEESVNANSLMQEAREVQAGPIASLLQKLSNKKQELREELSAIHSLLRDEIDGLTRNKHRLENKLIAANDRMSVLSSKIGLRLKTITQVKASRDPPFG
jgi:hypothetical protein